MTATRDTVIALVLVSFGVFVVWEASRMPRFEHLTVNPYTVPGIVPAFLGASLTLFGLVMLVRGASARRKRATTDAETATGADPGSGSETTAARSGRESTLRLGITLALTLGYAAGLVGRVPFWLATLIFVFAFIVAFDGPAARAGRRVPRLILTASLQAVVVAGAIAFVFERLFLVRLP